MFYHITKEMMVKVPCKDGQATSLEVIAKIPLFALQNAMQKYKYVQKWRWPNYIIKTPMVK